MLAIGDWSQSVDTIPLDLVGEVMTAS